MIFCLMGPTASGKTDLAVTLAAHFPFEIISVDSALVYRGLDIGSGKPSQAILQKAPHYLIDICDPSEPYNAGRFVDDALKIIKDILERGKIPLLVGGTMMYFKALLGGLARLPASNSIIRSQLDSEAEKLGWPALHERLSKIDALTAARLKPTDAQRIQRALEIFLVSGKSLSAWISEAKQDDFSFPYPVCAIGFIPTDVQRKILHTRIEQRFLKMLDQGLIEEVKKLWIRSDLNLNMPAIRSVGYRQVWQYLSGEFDYDTMKEKAIAATRQLAKRQITWLRTWPDLIQVDFFDDNVLSKLCQVIEERRG